MPTKPTSTFTHESLAQTAEDLAKYAAEIRAVAERMKFLELDRLEITNNDQRARALEYADNFATAARKSLREAQDARFVRAAKAEKPGGKRVRKSAAPAEQ